MTLSLFLPLDSAAKACGAEAVAAAILAEAKARGIEASLTRTGSRGMMWLEPLLEVEEDGVRRGFGPVSAADVPAIFDANFGDHPKAVGPVEKIPFFARQTRLTFTRCGIVDPLRIDQYEATGGLSGLRRALSMSPQQVIDEVKTSGLRGRGGAGFPTGIKWQTVHDAPADQKYICCNADEGDSASFADRMILEGDPFHLIEGMAIGAYAVGATKGYVYLRSEYPDAAKIFAAALEVAREAGLLGPSMLGTGPAFDIELRMGAGAYVCGEETSMLNSMEGKRGVVRAKPPLPALEGFMGRPTVVNNLISLATVPVILDKGGEHYRDFGLGRSRGTVPVQVGGNVARGGLFEAAFGLTLGELLHDICGGTASGRPIKAAQVGGPLGAWFPDRLFDTQICYEEFDKAGGLVGHAGVTVADDAMDMGEYARFAMEFCAVESCGKCTPCRIGAIRGMETVERLRNGDADAEPLLRDLCETMKMGSLCALGGFTPYPVLSALDHFPEDFAPKVKEAAE